MTAASRASADRFNVAVLTTARSEYYQVRPILQALDHSKTLDLKLIVSGTHLSPQFGQTERDIITDGFRIDERLPILVEDGTSLGFAMTAGLALEGVAAALVRSSADLLLLMGDRAEALAAAVAATCIGIPVAHVHGGERTDGALDDNCRHAITKLAALHFVTTDVYRARVLQLGESPDQVFTVGAPFVDQIQQAEPLSEAAFAARLGMDLQHPIALVAYHPATRDQQDEADLCQSILEETAACCKTLILTHPNNDPGREVILETMSRFAQSRPNVGLFANLGSQGFLSGMACADVMVGNSSSGIHEAASFQLPVINIGSRQSSRLHPANVLTVDIGHGTGHAVGGSFRSSLRETLHTALSSQFRDKLNHRVSPFGDGRAAPRIVETLERLAPFTRFLQKSFQDGPGVVQATNDWMSRYG